jgi:hypothetical protein
MDTAGLTLEYGGPIPWDKFVAEILEGYKPPLRARSTWYQMRYALRRVTLLTAGPDDPEPLVKSTADLTPRMISRLIESWPPELSPHTLKGLLVHV